MKKAGITIAAALVAISLTYHYISSKNPCHQTRIAFDIGSGAIKSESAIIDTCKNEIVKMLDERVEPVKLATCITTQGTEKTLDTSCIDRSIEAFFQILDHYKLDCQTTQCSGIATEWARQVTNGNLLIDKLASHGLRVKIVDQQTEGEIGFNSAFVDPNIPNIDRNKAVVWDVGGASFQLSTLDENGNLYVFEGRHGIEVFEKELREVIDRAHHAHHPYLTKEEIDQAIEEGKKILNHNLINNSFVKNKIESHQAIVYAIGRPFNVGNLKQLKMPKTFTKNDLLEYAYKFIGKTKDDVVSDIFPELSDHYARSAQVALILMYVVMDAIDVDSATVADSTMTRALFVDPKYWTQD